MKTNIFLAFLVIACPIWALSIKNQTGPRGQRVTFTFCSIQELQDFNVFLAERGFDIRERTNYEINAPDLTITIRGGLFELFAPTINQVIQLFQNVETQPASPQGLFPEQINPDLCLAKH